MQQVTTSCYDTAKLLILWKKPEHQHDKKPKGAITYSGPKLCKDKCREPTVKSYLYCEKKKINQKKNKLKNII